VIKEFVDEFCDLVWKELGGKGIKGIGVTGSYARGDYSKTRPDVNFAVFGTSDAAVSWKIGRVASGLNKKYSQWVNLRPEYHPERFAAPWGRDINKTDLFFKIAFFDVKERDLLMPFGRPGYVLEGHKLSIKMWHGRNLFEDIIVTSSNDEVIKGCNYMYSQWVRAIKLTPLAYDLEQDADLFFGEALVWGKIAVQQYAWVQGIKNGLDYVNDEDRMKIFSRVHDKEKLRGFFKLPRKEQEMVNLILDARKKYQEWKTDSKMAEKLYQSSYHLLNYFWDETKKLMPK